MYDIEFGLYRRKMPPNPIQYGGGSWMVWGCFVDGGSGARMKINGIIIFAKYQDILAQNLFASARRLAVDGTLFFI